jgi:uncharacterized protein (DUF3084 family)
MDVPNRLAGQLPPPPPPRSSWPPLRLVPTPDSAPETEAVTLLRQELERAREELDALQDLLEELPTIFERKFRQHLASLHQEQRQLLEQNHWLRQRLLGQVGGALGALPAAAAQLPAPPALRADQTRVGSPHT